MKSIIYLSIAIIVLLLVGVLPVYAYEGGHGGGHSGYGGYGGHGGYYGRGYRGGAVGWIGPGWWYPWWGLPYYPYDYSEPPVVIQQQAPVYEQQAPVEEQEYYWYFCPDSKAYYPYVKQCPSGWMKVVPPHGPQK